MTFAISGSASQSIFTALYGASSIHSSTRSAIPRPGAHSCEGTDPATRIGTPVSWERVR